MSSENRKGGSFGGRGGRNDDRGGRDGRNDDRGDRGGRGGRNDERGGRGGRNDERSGRGGRGGGGGRYGSSERDRSPPRDDRIRDPYMEPFRGGGSRAPFPPGGDFGIRDPYFQEPFRRGGFPEPWLADDPYSQDPYADPYRDPFRHGAPPPPVIECEIFVQNTMLRAYGDAVERRVKENNIITAVSIIPEGRTSQQLVEEVSAQSALFAIFINPQNELHRSLTLNILHGTPQEHRNMPLDDAIALVGRSFLKYVESLREKAQAAAAPLPSTNRVFLPPSSEVSYLLNLLADNRVLTIPELDTVIKYLQDRRGKLADAESRPIYTDDSYGKTPPSQRLDHQAQPSNQENAATNSKEATSSSQQDLTSKILSIFTNAGVGVQGVPPANGTQQQPGSKLPSGAPAPPPPPPQATAASSAALINFDNPNVQKALDNLIQSTPSLLKNINTNTPSSSTPHNMGTSSAANNMGPMNSGGYGQGGGQMQGTFQTGYGTPQGHQMSAVGHQMPSIGHQMSAGQGMMGSHVPSLQDYYNMIGQAAQGHMATGYGQQSQSRF